MKNNSVCFVIHSLQAGGMERVMSELINYFASKNTYEVHVVLYGIKRDVFFKLSDKVIIHKPKFEFDNAKRFWSTLKTISFLRKEIKAINPVSLLSFGERWNNLVLLSLYGTGIPVYVSDRSQPDKSIGKLNQMLRKLLYPKAKGGIVQTTKPLDIFKSYYHHPNFKVIGNPIRQITPKECNRQNIILMVGRYIESKQQNVLIEIFSQLNAPDWKLVLLGYDHLKQSNQIKWESLANELGLKDRVIFTGKQDDVEHYYLTSKIFAFTSVSEGFPNVIGEAMSAGLPVVAFDCIAGPSDLITDEENGFLIPINNRELFAQKLQFLIDNPQEIINQGNNAKRNIIPFELNYICSQFENFIIPNPE